jgi:RND superfamily putative drug exporter
LMMFAILFGLSMDYEVFLMTHVREQYKETGDPHEAVVHGLAATARVITSAAMIMVSVFLAFVINGDPTVKQFGLAWPWRSRSMRRSSGVCSYQPSCP